MCLWSCTCGRRCFGATQSSSSFPPTTRSPIMQATIQIKTHWPRLCLHVQSPSPPACHSPRHKTNIQFRRVGLVPRSHKKADRKTTSHFEAPCFSFTHPSSTARALASRLIPPRDVAGAIPRVYRREFPEAASIYQELAPVNRTSSFCQRGRRGQTSRYGHA